MLVISPESQEDHDICHGRRCIRLLFISLIFLSVYYCNFYFPSYFVILLHFVSLNWLFSWSYIDVPFINSVLLHSVNLHSHAAFPCISTLVHTPTCILYHRSQVYLFSVFCSSALCSSFCVYASLSRCLSLSAVAPVFFVVASVEGQWPTLRQQYAASAKPA